MLEEFKIALCRGSGRAMLLLRASPDHTELHAALWHACVNDLRYDTDEEGRAAYLYRLIRETPSPAVWRDKLFTHLEVCGPGGEDGAIGQVFGILCRLTGEDEAMDRAKLWSFLEASDYSGIGWRCAHELVRLEGIEALLKCLRTFHDELTEEALSHWSLINVLEEREGVEQSTAKLQEARSHFPELDAAMLQIEADRKPFSPRSEEPVDYAVAKAELDERGSLPSGFYRNPGSGNLVLAAHDLLMESEIRSIKAYLLLFGKWDFPLSPPLLLRFLCHSDDRVSFRASKALGRLRHSKIRDAALSLVEKRQLATAMRLLKRNYQPGDMEHVLVSIDAATADQDELHSLQFAVREVLRHSSVDREEAVRMLMRMYELITCSLCRWSILKAIEERIAVPSWILEECVFDADPDVVAMAAIGNASSHRRADV